jgi:uncharacterized membrane protein
MTAKKPSSSTVLREEVRLMSEAIDATEAKTTGLSPEFLTLGATVLTNIVGVLVLIGWVDSSQAAEITKSLVALVGGVQAIVVNSVLVWKFLAARFATQKTIAEMRIAAIRAAQTERMMAR